MKRIAFVIITWNSQAHIEACLESVYESLTHFDSHVWVIDNGSKDQTEQMIHTIKKEKFKNRLHFIKSDKNLGTTVSRNLALREIRKAKDVDYVCIIDSDTKINTEALRLMINALDQHDDTLIASPRLQNDQNLIQISAKHFPTFLTRLLKALPSRKLNLIGKHKDCYDFDCENCKNHAKLMENKEIESKERVYEVDFTVSACWIVKPDALTKVGLLDENIFYLHEDVNYCARVHEAGYKIVLVYDALIKHYKQSISKTKIFNWMYLYHLYGLIFFYFSQYGRKEAA